MKNKNLSLKKKNFVIPKKIKAVKNFEAKTDFYDK